MRTPEPTDKLDATTARATPVAVVNGPEDDTLDQRMAYGVYGQQNFTADR